MKFTIITPVYNGEKYIAETIESIVSQEGDFEIEYIIQDGGSIDETLTIVKSYADKIKSGSHLIKCSRITLMWFSEKDRGMYDAIEKGLARTTGEVMAYLNADDTYLPGAFAAVATIFRLYPEIEWVKGINTSCNENGTTLSEGECRLYRREWLQKGIYGRSAYFVQQDSVFWRRSLWEKAHPTISSLRFAGDYALWVTFAAQAPLWSFNRRVSTFRKHTGQLSEVMTPYRAEQELIAPHYFFLEKRVLLFYSLLRSFNLNPRNTAAGFFFFILFPLQKRELYIDFDIQGNPMKKSSASYLI